MINQVFPYFENGLVFKADIISVTSTAMFVCLLFSVDQKTTGKKTDVDVT